MTRSISRNPLFHKGLTTYTADGTVLPAELPESTGRPLERHGVGTATPRSSRHIRWLREIGRADVFEVGRKAASLAEMLRELTPAGSRLPDGFVTSVSAYDAALDAPLPEGALETLDGEDVASAAVPGLLGATTLREALEGLLQGLDPSDREGLIVRTGAARALVRSCPLPDELRRELAAGYHELCRKHGGTADAAVRLSATYEDSPGAAFAGQYESFVSVRGAGAVVEAWRGYMESVLTERAVSYRLSWGLDPVGGGLNVIVMRMVG